ncbi:hypothetical protein LUZ60_017407 [Juncus effusus]|nr:hypothetical protein LUZ60_017407 [Juncus effusus]
MRTSYSLISFSLCLFILFHGCIAQIGFGGQSLFQSARGSGSDQRACPFDRLEAIGPPRRVQSEAGFIELYEEKNAAQLECAGLSSNKESESETQRLRDEHQKVHRIRQGDIIAIPADVTRWVYNDRDVPLAAVVVLDISSTNNRHKLRQREFLLAGRSQSILNGFDIQLLAEALGVNPELVRKLQTRTEQGGEIVHVQHGFQLLRASRSQEPQQEQEFQGERYQEGTGLQGNYSNGLDESFCTMRIRENIDDPSRADFFNPRAGRITTINSQKLPILNNVQMSVSRIVLRRNVIHPPHWTINAQSLIYVTSGQARIQVVNDQGITVFDGQLHDKQVLLIPQNYAVMKRASRQGFEYVSFKTDQNAMVSDIFGNTSIVRSMPIDVLRVSYRLSTQQAWKLKNSSIKEFVFRAAD